MCVNADSSFAKSKPKYQICSLCANALDPAQLQWGIEKTIDTRLEAVGAAKQAFVIETSP